MENNLEKKEFQFSIDLYLVLMFELKISIELMVNIQFDELLMENDFQQGFFDKIDLNKYQLMMETK